MTKKYCYQSNLKDSVETEIQKNKKLCDSDKILLRQMLFEVIKEYEYGKALIKQSISYLGQEPRYSFYTREGYITFQKREDFARYVFTYSPFAKHIKSNLHIDTECGSIGYQLLKAGTESLIDFAKSGVFRDISKNGLVPENVY